jgi:hypothetical protein
VVDFPAGMILPQLANLTARTVLTKNQVAARACVSETGAKGLHENISPHADLLQFKTRHR